MSRILTIALSASLLSTSVMAADAPGPRPGTVEAMQCLIRQGPAECTTMFRGGARKSAMPWLFANPDRDFKRGPLISGSYWGRASDTNRLDAMVLIGQPTKEMDIFDVKFRHVEYKFYISPADADGKIRALAIGVYAPHDALQLLGG